MKKSFFLTVLAALMYMACNKHVDNIPTTQTLTIQPIPVRQTSLIANAGRDTTICMPYGGTGERFKAILNGTVSHDDSGKIVSYAWTQLGAGFQYSNKDSTIVILQGGIYLFRLIVQDDHGRVDDDTVTITVIPQFDDEYDGLSWDSASGTLKTISVKLKPNQIESWPDFTSLEIDKSSVYFSESHGECIDISQWEKIPYVPYDSIQLTDKPVFYSLISQPVNNINPGALYPEIYAKTNSGMDFNQKISIGFIERSPWDY